MAFDSSIVEENRRRVVTNSDKFGFLHHVFASVVGTNSEGTLPNQILKVLLFHAIAPRLFA
jgi:hypothetical protein